MWPLRKGPSRKKCILVSKRSKKNMNRNTNLVKNEKLKETKKEGAKKIRHK